MVGKLCYDCKYYVWDICLHKEAVRCNHAELWTPVGFGCYDISMFNLPDNINDLIEYGVYTEEEVVNNIIKSRINRLTGYKDIDGCICATPLTSDINAIIAKLAEYEDKYQNGEIVFTKR